METTRCDLCGADDTEVVLQDRDRLHGIDGAFGLVRCRQCGLMYLNPRPTLQELPRYYPEDYGPHRVESSRPSPVARLDRWYGSHKRCQAVVSRAAADSRRVLDIGCATGAFLEAMRRRGGWQVYGVEIDTEVAGYARSVRNLDVFAGTVEAASYPDGFFDVVTLWNVLEHLHSPRKTLDQTGRILKNGGLLVCSIPNPECVEAKVFGRYWAGWDMPRHLYSFTRQVAGRLLSDTGFDITGVSSFTGRYQATILSMGHWMDDRIPHPGSRRVLKRAIRSLPARVLTLPYYLVADRLNQSSVMTIFARRR